MADDTKSKAGDPAQMARPLLAYRCVADGDIADALCRAFGELLGQKAPGHALRRLSPDEAAPALREGDLLLTLHAGKLSAYSLSARLEWQDGPARPADTGPDVSLEGSDAPLAPAMYPGFLRDLWHLGAPPALTGPDR